MALAVPDRACIVYPPPLAMACSGPRHFRGPSAVTDRSRSGVAPSDPRAACYARDRCRPRNGGCSARWRVGRPTPPRISATFMRWRKRSTGSAGRSHAQPETSPEQSLRHARRGPFVWVSPENRQCQADIDCAVLPVKCTKLACTAVRRDRLGEYLSSCDPLGPTLDPPCMEREVASCVDSICVAR